MPTYTLREGNKTVRLKSDTPLTEAEIAEAMGEVAAPAKQEAAAATTAKPSGSPLEILKRNALDALTRTGGLAIGTRKPEGVTEHAIQALMAAGPIGKAGTLAALRAPATGLLKSVIPAAARATAGGAIEGGRAALRGENPLPAAGFGAAAGGVAEGAGALLEKSAAKLAKPVIEHIHSLVSRGNAEVARAVGSLEIWKRINGQTVSVPALGGAKMQVDRAMAMLDAAPDAVRAAGEKQLVKELTDLDKSGVARALYETLTEATRKATVTKAPGVVAQGAEKVRRAAGSDAVRSMADATASESQTAPLTIGAGEGAAMSLNPMRLLHLLGRAL